MAERLSELIYKAVQYYDGLLEHTEYSIGLRYTWVERPNSNHNKTLLCPLAAAAIFTEAKEKELENEYLAEHGKSGRDTVLNHLIRRGYTEPDDEVVVEREGGAKMHPVDAVIVLNDVWCWDVYQIIDFLEEKGY
jgi:hypothetical protein